ncbi:hypothetical protein HanRHA438_Chr03g0142701 [Helianthus annuus]|nr:hypothetical protein HanRHA438_Chr03g0142701 [Helianthus annuus]
MIFLTFRVIAIPFALLDSPIFTRTFLQESATQPMLLDEVIKKTS